MCEGKGKGKEIANKAEWIKIMELTQYVEVDWFFNPRGPNYQAVQAAADSMAKTP